MDTTANRLKRAMEIRNMKAIDLHDKTGIGKSSISQYMNGKVKPKQDRIYLMAQALNVDELWLMGHDVPMERIERAESAPPPSQPYRAELTEHEREHIELYRELDERGRNAVDDLTDLHVERVRESTERSSGSTGTENAAEKRA